MDKKKNYADLKRFSEAQGIGLFGVASVKGIRKDFLIDASLADKLDYGISLGVGLSAAILDEIKLAPTKLYFHHYRTVNAFLDQAALKVCNFIQKKGFQALPIPASQILDWQSQKAHLSHKKVGLLAGLGWIGRNNLLVNDKFGAQFRLCTVLTDMSLIVARPLKKDCGNCRLCVESCPAQAIHENYSDFDHLRCFEKLKEFQKQRLVDQYICGVCVNVCRPKRKAA